MAINTQRDISKVMLMKAYIWIFDLTLTPPMTSKHSSKASRSELSFAALFVSLRLLMLRLVAGGVYPPPPASGGWQNNSATARLMKIVLLYILTYYHTVSSYVQYVGFFVTSRQVISKPSPPPLRPVLGAKRTGPGVFEHPHPL